MLRKSDDLADRQPTGADYVERAVPRRTVLVDFPVLRFGASMRPSNQDGSVSEYILPIVICSCWGEFQFGKARSLGSP